MPPPAPTPTHTIQLLVLVGGKRDYVETDYNLLLFLLFFGSETL